MSKNKILLTVIILCLSVIVGINCKVHKAVMQSAIFTVKPGDSILMDQSDDSLYSGVIFNENVRSTKSRTAEEERLGFKLPPGFEVTLFASEPDIGKPINIAFDAKGRMWVTQSFEYPFPAVAPRKGRDRLTILEDTDHDGRADKFTQVSDTLNIPIGVQPLNDGGIVYSIPNIYRYTETGDGQYTSKKLLGPFGHKDTHGMVNNMSRGYSGWVDVDHGFTNTSTIAGADGHSITMVSGNTFRFKIDGSRVEQTTFGRVNPFGLAYDEKGYLYGSDCSTSPLYQLIRGGDYVGFGKGETIGFAPDMEGMTNEASALAGLAYYDDHIFPAQFQHKLFMGDVVACRVYEYSWINKGTSPIGKKDHDFMKSKDPWFRPVDVKVGPDGALYVADFYNSIIGHYEVPLDDPRRDKVRGRIWRITYKGQGNKVHDWTKATIDELIAAFDKENISVRMAIGDQLADRIGTDAIAPLKAVLKDKNTSPIKYIHAMWVLQRLGALDDKIIKKSAGSEESLIRLHTMRILLEQEPNQQLYPLILKALNDEDPDVQRAAMDVLCHYPGMTSLTAALATRKKIPDYDTHFIYTTRLCIRNLLIHRGLMQQVVAKQWDQQDAANIADILVDIPYPESATFMAQYIDKYGVPPKIGLSYHLVGQFIPYGQANRVIASARHKGSDLGQQLEIFRGLQGGIASRGEAETQPLQDWGTELSINLLTATPANATTNAFVVDRQQFAIQLAGKYKIASLQPQLKAFLEPGSIADLDTKTAALRALLRIDPEQNAEFAGRLFQDPSASLEVKVRVATALGDLTGSTGAINDVLQRVNKMLAQVKNAPPDLQSAIVMSLAGSPEGKDIIFNKVRQGELFARVLTEPKIGERILLNISPKQKHEYDRLIANLEPVNTERDKTIFQLAMAWGIAKNYHSLPPIDSGHAVFIQNCSPCHTVGTEGGNIGPNLDGISKWGPGNLLTKIVDPNRNISEAFRNYTIKLKDGSIQSGLYRRDEGEVIVFADNTGHEFKIQKKDIAEQTASKYTLMPDDFRYRLSAKQFTALINFLLNHK